VKIAVFGSTGKTGRLLIDQALAEKYTVAAFARHPEKIGDATEGLTVIVGELDNPAAIDRAVDGADAVVSLLGQGRPVRGTPCANGTRNILAAMSKAGVRRIVAIATASAADPLDRPPLRSRLLIGFARVFMRPAYDDAVATAQAVRESDRDWTIVRPPLLRDGPRTGRVKTGYLGDGVTGTYLSRANAADFMLRQLKSDQYVGQAPVVSDG